MIHVPKTIKFIYSEKATKFFEISTVDLSYVVPLKDQLFLISHFVFRRQPAEFLFSKKNVHMKAGQKNKYDITKASGLA